MSITATAPDDDSAGFPEFTALGKQLEMLRIGRGISKQHLARFAGTSRQQLWRVMTGKSELTDTLRQRLGQALGVDLSALGGDAPASTSNAGSMVADLRLATVNLALPIETYLATAEYAERTLRTLPNGEAGRELKRNLLNALEDQAVTRDIPLPAGFFDLRRRVLAHEL
ncbi:MAG: helix-turn-helix domain-containing protein [Gemmatimonadaceae bacterium]